ncbi:MAG: DNA-protecting protein DprA [Tissierellia bacterium]|nr:DNA-protecting protein DprA [Tissierellia bacterium]
MEIKLDDLIIWLNNLYLDAYQIDIVLNNFEDIEFFFSKEAETVIKKLLPKNVTTKIIENRDVSKIKDLVSQVKDKYNIITCESEEFPSLLKLIEGSPKLLYYKGDISLLNNELLAVVGARKITTYGKWACEKLIREISNYPISIASGLAIGTDTVAHKAAIDNGLKTVGVLGTGIDLIYPQRNRALFEEMEANHLIITEFRPGTPGYKTNFPMRNRIISGISKAALIIEAKRRSGSLITARNAFEQGREVFAVPGNINSILSEGTNDLIKDSANPATEGRDIIEGVESFRKLKDKSDSVSIDIDGLSDDERKIYEILKEGPSSIDIISFRTGMAVTEINPILTILEIKGCIKEIAASNFSII